MRKIEISSRVAACASALVLAGSTLAACGGSSGTTPNGSSAAHPGTSSAATTSRPRSSNNESSARPSTKALSARTRAQIAQRLRSLRSRAGSAHATGTPALRQAAFRTALTHFAGCLRQQGVKISAPNASGNGPTLNLRGVNTNSPQYRAALAKCRGVLISAFRQAARARG